MTVLIASDLDRTLIYSADARTLGPDEAATVCVETYDGREISFMTAQATARLGELARTTCFVPVTTRTVNQFRRVRMPASRYAVTTNGAVLLVDGAPDDEWATRVRHELRASAPLNEVWAHLGRTCAAEFTTALRNAEDVFCYAVLRPDAVPDGFVAELTRWADDHGWRTSLQGRKLYCVPRSVTKAAAVEEAARRVASSAVLSAGDSLLDIDLLLVADRGIHPAHGELFDRGWTAPSVSCTAATGIAAGEEIVDWFASGASEDLAVQQ